MLWSNWRAARGRLAAILAGMAAILAAAAVLDTLTLGYPFASVWRYVLYNVFYGVSSTFGVEPWPYYLLRELGVSRGAGATILLLTAIGAWRLPLLLVVAIAILGLHSGIAHKEYRFIYPAIVPLTVLAGVGLAQMASWGQEWLISRSMPVTAAAATSAALAVAWWGLASCQVWNGATLDPHRQWSHNRLFPDAFAPS